MIMRTAMLLRASLLPYIYSNARFAYDEGMLLLDLCEWADAAYYSLVPSLSNPQIFYHLQGEKSGFFILQAIKIWALERLGTRLVYYTSVHITTGLSLLRPMYYEFPDVAEAYTFDHQVAYHSIYYSDTHLS